MGIFDRIVGTYGRGLGGAIGEAAKKYVFKSWEGAQSPYGRPVPLAYGVTWVRGIQVYSGEPFVWYEGTAGAPAMLVPVYTTDKATGDVSIKEEAQACQSAVLVLCERATTILDIIKDGVSINSGKIDDDPITTVTQRLRMLSGRVPSPAGIIPPSGQEHGYFHGGTGTAPAHSRFSRSANLGAAPYTYSNVSRVDFCALGIGTRNSRPSLQFKVQALLAESSSVGAHPADVLVDLWTRAGKDPAKLDVETYYRAYVTSGGGSGSTAWRVNRTIDSQTSARELMQALLDETFSTVVKKENGSLMVVPRDVASGTATAIGVNDFVPGGGPPVTVEMKQASDCFNSVPVTYEVTAASGTHTVTNEDTTFAVAHPFSATETIRRSPTVATKWVSTPEHALNLSHLLAEENFTVRATYKFRLHKRWVLLQEHDLLSLTEPHLGLSAKVVKIRRISEDGSGVISVQADEWFGQVSYTTPEVDPFDGFEPLPGNPQDPVSAEVAAMGDDGQLTPVEKPAFFRAVQGIWHAIRELEDAGGEEIPLHGGSSIVLYGLAFKAYLGTLGFTFEWADIDRNWTDPGSAAAMRGLLAGWMQVTTPVVASEWQDAFGTVTTAISDLRANLLTPMSTAVANGTTNDHDPIQAAITSGAGREVVIAPGVYAVHSGLTVPPGVTVRAYGVTFDFSAAGNITALTLGAGAGVLGLKIVGAGNAAYNIGGVGISCQGTRNEPSAPTMIAGPTLRDVIVESFSCWGIYVAFASGGSIENCKVTSCGYGGIAVISCTDMKVRGNRVASITPGSTNAYGIVLSRSSGSLVGDPPTERVQVIGNTVVDIPLWAGIDTHGGRWLTIAGNIVKGCKLGIDVTDADIGGTPAVAPRHIAIAGNVIESTVGGSGAGSGIVVTGPYSGGSTVDYADSISITGNTISGHGALSGDTDDGAIRARCTKNLVISGNTLRRPQVNGIFLYFDNLSFAVTGNVVVDPNDTTVACSCIRVGGGTLKNNNRGAIVGNTLVAEDTGLATKVAERAVYSAAGTGYDLVVKDNALLGVAAGRLAMSNFSRAYAAGDTTPSVANTEFLAIGNSSPVTITAFDDGAEGQTITLYFGDANTTIDRTSCYLAGGVDFVSTAQDTLTLRKFGAVWFEVARGVNS